MLKTFFFLIILNFVISDIQTSLLCVIEDKDFLSFFENSLDKILNGNITSLIFYIINNIKKIIIIFINCFNYKQCINKI